MPKIYLVSNTKTLDSDIINISPTKISFFNFYEDLNLYDALILTSKNSVKSLEFNKIKPSNLDLFVIGEACKKYAMDYGFTKIYCSKFSHGDEFGYEILPNLKNKKVLYLRAKKINSKLNKILKNGGINLKEQIAYESFINETDLSLRPKDNSIIIFTSPSNVKAFIQKYGWNNSYSAIAIGKTTAKELNFTKKLTISKIQTIHECINLAKTLF